jgi:hypothetical protein
MRETPKKTKRAKPKQPAKKLKAKKAPRETPQSKGIKKPARRSARGD